MRQRLQGRQIAHYQLRLIERAHHVFAQRVVNARLATYGGIHLRQQRRGYLNKGNTAHIARRGKTGHIAHHPTAKCEQHRFAVTTIDEQGIEDEIERLPGLVLLTIGEADEMDGLEPCSKRFLERGGVQRSDRFVGDNQCASCLRKSAKDFRVIKQGRRDDNAITSLSECDVDRMHGWVFHAP